MSDDDVDLSKFVSVKGKRRGGGGRQAATTSAAAVPSHDAADAATPLARPQRKVASEQRRLDTEVAREEERAALIRSLTLNGIEAKRQAEARARAVAVAGGPKPQPPSVADAYALATSCERGAKTPAQEKEAVRLWELVFSLAEAGLQEGTGDAEALRRAQMTSLCHRAPFYERQLQLRFAINLLERVVVLARSVRVDAATRTAIVGVLRKLSALHTAVGAVEKAQQRILAAHSLQQQQQHQGGGKLAPQPLARATSDTASAGAGGRAPPAGPVSRAASAPEARPSSTAGAGAAPVTPPVPAAPFAKVAPPLSSPPPAASSGPSPQSGGTEGTAPVAAAPVEAAATPAATAPDWRSIFDAQPSDGPARAAFLAAMRDAMLDGSFDALVRLLNRGLLGDRAAQSALIGALPGVRLSAVMVAAGAGRADVLRRLLAPLPPQRVAQAALRDVDFAGNNALFHACTTGHLASADELLRAVYTASVAAGAAVTAGPHPLALLGLDAARVGGFAAPVQHLLSAFLSDPGRYVREFRVAAIGGSASPPPAAPPPPPPPPPAAPQLYFPGPHHQFHQLRPGPAQGHPHPGWPGVPLPLAASAAMFAQMQAATAYAMQAWAAAAAATAARPPPQQVPTGAPGRPLPPAASSQGGEDPMPIHPQAPAAAPAHPAPASTPAKEVAAVAAPVAATAAPPPAPAAATAAAGVPKPPSSGVGRELTPMALPGSGEGGLDDGCLGDDDGAPWDQFAANKALGVSLQGFKAELYTSALDRGAFTAEQIAAADAIARSILEQTEPEGPDAPGDASHVLEEREEAAAGASRMKGGDDEEARYSAVSRPAAAARGSAGAVAAPGSGAAGADALGFTDAGVAARAAAKKSAGK